MTLDSLPAARPEGSLCPLPLLDAAGRPAAGARTWLRAWLRHHVDEWRYNPDLGGMAEPARLLAEAGVVAVDEGAPAAPIRRALAAVFAPSPRDPVSIYRAECPGQAEPFHAIDTALSPELAGYVARLQHENAFELAELFDARLQMLARHIERDIAADSLFYRARLGVPQRYARRDGGWGQTVRYQPFSGAKMTAPPPPFAPAGRANRQGVAVLYLASDVLTAVAEIRPHPAHLISVSEFVATRDLRIADFGTLDFKDWWRDDAAIALYHLAVSLDRALSEAVVPEHRHRYTVTQLLAELLRQRGYDGIRFRSAVASGTNLCIFRPHLFRERGEGGRVLRVEALRYDFAELPTLLSPGADDWPLDLEN